MKGKTKKEDKAEGEPKLGRESTRGPPFGVLFSRRASPCSPLPTLGSALAMLVSTGASFVFWSKSSKRIFVGKGTYPYVYVYKK